MLAGQYPWREIADRVFVHRHPCYDVNVGLVVGDDGCLVVDTLSTHRQARALIAAIREVTATPWSVVNTHAHFDHCFGNAMFRPAPIWAHSRTARNIREFGEAQRRTLSEQAMTEGKRGFHDELSDVRIDPPDRLLDNMMELTIGGRSAVVRFLGRGHTDGDVVVEVPDCRVLFTGDLIEESASPGFEDSFPMDWPATAAALLPLAHDLVVPGHGDLVDRDFVERQAGDLASVAEHARAAHACGRRAGRRLPALPFDEAASQVALTRALWQLDTRP